MKRSALSGCGASAGIPSMSTAIYPLLRDPKADMHLVAGLARPVAGLDDIARIAEGDTQIAVGKIIDVLRGVELADVGANFFESGHGLVEVAELAAHRVEPEIGECRREDLLRGIDQRNPARPEPRRDRRIEDQPQAVSRSRLTQCGMELGLVHANPGEAPQIRHP